jgi:cell division protein FtsI/penicillin-binding protein 2
MTRRRVVVGVAVVVATAGIAFGLTRIAHETSTAAQDSASAFLRAWARGDATAMAAKLDGPPPADFAKVVGSVATSAPGSKLSARPTRVKTKDGQATANYHASLDVAAFGPFAWDGELTLVKVKKLWRVHWTPDALFPGLATGQRLVVHRAWATRAPILGADGKPLVADEAAVAVGLEPDHIKDLNHVKGSLTQLLSIDPAAVDKALSAPGVQPSFFVPIITLRTERYNALHDQLEPVPGIVFQKTHARFAAADNLAVHVVGRVGEITAERLAKLGPPYRIGDTVGLSGLESAYETRLAGRPTGTLDIVDANGTVLRAAHTFAGTDPHAVQVTLDAATQIAANQALQGVTKPAALVALDAATGEIRAVVSLPNDQPFNRALDGQYPPGSTFKVVTATALLTAGTTAQTPAPCPTSRTVSGRRFTNFEGEAPGDIVFHQAFAISCNTAFIGLATQLPSGALAAAAKSFGFDAPYQLPLPAKGGKFPDPSDAVELAAAAIGQGRVTASPLHLATVAATVASGQWRPPILVRQPADITTPTTTPVVPPPALAPATLDALRSLMTEVVVSGTGRAAAVRGQQIAGKTGTAEFGTGNPPKTHAWFIGFRGNLAFAVLVEDGGVGGEVAAPIAARFVTALGS